MNDSMENFQEMDIEIKKLLDNIENVKSVMDLYGTIVDEQLLSVV